MGLFGSPTASAPQDRVDIDHLTARIAALEATVQQLQRQLAIAVAGTTVAPTTGGGPAAMPEPPFMAEVRGLLAQGKKINAIKVYREHTAVDLRTAKDAVEHLT